MNSNLYFKFNSKRLIIERLIERLRENTDATLKPILNKILHLASLHFLEKHAAIFYQGGYFVESTAFKPLSLIRETLLDLCKEMKDDAVAMVDALAPPDFVLNSPLGDSNGNVYLNLYNSMAQTTGAFERMDFLNDFMQKTTFASKSSYSSIQSPSKL
jgi:acyl-CoA oxidase